MAFIVPRNPLSPGARLTLSIAPGTLVLSAAELHALRSAEQAIADAKLQAQAIVDAARVAFEEERQRGFKEGQEEARFEQAESMTEVVMRTVDYFGDVEHRMVDLVMQSVQKIVMDFDDSSRVLNTVKNMLAVVRNQKQMTLRLHPQQVDMVKSRLNELLQQFPGVGYLDITGDNRLALDACILESEIGVIEGSLEGQLAALRSAFVKILGSRT